MKTFLITLLIVAIAVASSSAIRAHIRDVNDYNTDDSQEDNYDSRERKSDEPVDSTNNPSEDSEAFAISPFSPQCMYDFNGHRLNTDCPTEKPPKCEKGALVLTAVGQKYEMCCCNYSNIL